MVVDAVVNVDAIDDIAADVIVVFRSNRGVDVAMVGGWKIIRID